jgi:nicotinate-nucleotide adenylyltransferase
MRRGIFGGTYNPPHWGHLLVAESIRESLSLDIVTFVPTSVPPHKYANGLVAPEHRMEMVRCAIAGNPGFEVSDVEIRRGGVSYTVDTLQAFKDKDPTDSLHLLIGMDNLIEFNTWRSPETILQLAEVIVMTRPGFSRAPSGDSERFTFCSVPAVDVSSTDIRSRIKQHKSVRYLIPQAVAEYIRLHELYQ